MRAIIATCALLALATISIAQTTILQEGFESGFTPDCWYINNPGNNGLWEIDATNSHTGSSSIKLMGAVDNYEFVKDLGAPMTNLAFECWFYDDLNPELDTRICVTADPNHLQGTGQHLKIGVASGLLPNVYSVAEGFDYNILISGSERSLGWHKATFYNVEGVNYCFVDDQLIHTMNRPGFPGASVI